jgi:hypothetical protein
MVSESGIRTGQSCATDTREAVREFHAAVEQPDTALVLFFCSKAYDLDALADEMVLQFEGTQVMGCTTAGEIGPEGCFDHSISGASLPMGSFAVASGRIADLRHFDIGKGQALVQELLQKLEVDRPTADADNTFALLLIDGLSVREEIVASALQHALGSIPLVGGSAGDGLEFTSTEVYSAGAFHSDSAVLALVTTPLPFKVFMTQHFTPAEERIVVTSADADNRIVTEIDGRPAAAEYARLVGTTVENLDPAYFSASPVLVLMGGANYVRSIQRANPDGSLTFYCAIEEGLVLRVAEGHDMIRGLETLFEETKAQIGQPQLTIGCDCILRKLEASQSGVVDRADELFRENNLVGFHGYGEQYRGVHVNQTLTGIAIGSPQQEDADE